MDIRTHLAQKRPFLFDGAMGTWYAAQPGRTGQRCELANLDHPDEIAAIHRAYLDSGCQAVKTNTFSAGADLARGEEALSHDIIRTGCAIALEAASHYDALVFADLGPIPGDLPNAGDLYRTQADWFLSAGVTHFLLETLPDDNGVAQLAAHLKERCPHSFLLVSFAVDAAGVTRSGRQGVELLTAVSQLPGVDAVGCNCVCGPHHLLSYLRTLPALPCPVSIMPNAGYPTVLGRRTFFQGQPDYFAGQLAQLVQSGADIVGGCCGTTPDHIAAAARALAQPVEQSPTVTAAGEAPRRAPQPNPLWDKFQVGKRVVAVELDPPADDDLSFFTKGVVELQQAGADIVTIADCPVGRPRADSSLLACKVRRELGVEPLPHMACRDRNLNATKALLLGLSMEGVHNVLLVTGDPVPAEDRSEVKSVFNFNSRKLARYVSTLNEQLTTPFRIFGALNLNAHNFDVQLRLAVEKEECGMSGFLTQPVLSAEALENLKKARSVLKGKILGGIFPVVSHRNACFLNNEISGMRVCDEIIRLYEGRDREEAEHLAVTISARIAQEISPYTDGFYLMTPFRRVALMTRIMEELKSSGLM